MAVDPKINYTLQPALFEFAGTSTGAFEVFPRIWLATEALIDNDPANREKGLSILQEINAIRFFPLIGYLFITRLEDPDLALRTRLIQALAEVLLPDESGQLAPEKVKQSLLSHLTRLTPGQIYAILEALELDATLQPKGSVLIRANYLAGNDLVDILVDRTTPPGIRQQAAQMIARVGFVDSIPKIEKLIVRLESRLNGQQSFLYPQPDTISDETLLPVLRSVISSLQAL